MYFIFMLLQDSCQQINKLEKGLCYTMYPVYFPVKGNTVHITTAQTGSLGTWVMAVWVLENLTKFFSAE